MLDFFTLFGRGKEKSLIAGADQRGFTFLYDLGQRAVLSQVVLNRPKVYGTISIAVGDDLYVMDKKPCPGSFEALRFHDRRDWSWHCLPPPPYVFEPGYRPTRSIQSYTVVPSWPGTLIWVSTPGIGTYAFDVPSCHGLWSKAGDWVLPFLGRAEYLPEYGLWLGFSQETRMLCSTNLSDASMECGPRLLHNDWEELRVPQDWILNQSHLVHLGSGSFCVAKFFRIEHKETSLDGEIYTKIDVKFAVFTGLKLEHLRGESRMIKHRSVRYRFEPMAHSWVF